ncbi:hypothetical protein EDD11_000363 [Mortierella claussenii]|nr:hypothetical protein EDD11_000363 [Mortierella claussenii]
MTSRIGCISGTEELKEILAGHEPQLQQEAILSNRSLNADQERPLSYWSHIMEQLDAVGWERVTNLNKDLSQVQIELCDASQRKHTLTVRFPPGYPVASLVLEPLETPECDTERLSQTLPTKALAPKQGLGLVAAIEQAEKQLQDFKEFWDVMQDIDEKTWVIDPEQPTRADRMRRCVLGNHCSIQMTVDPMSPRSMPDTRLFGPTTTVEPLRNKLYRNANLWKLPRENLEALLELPDGFPSQVSVNKDEINIECGICYSFRFEGQIPDQLCSSVKCQQPFHRACLYDWLRNLTTTRQSFNTLFGVCPYCDETITTTAPRI